ncbi:MAG TPA: hypothetical protein PK350_07580 [Deltaproteobacteria bacterium]|nr:hypothetical protein [Deltaproteobacteria bacterium]HPR55737.1 hypothetical protein [Deltaproteobacteria bacterium]
MKAEKQVLTGVYVRLLVRYTGRFSPDEAKALAAAVTSRIFRLEPADAATAEYIRVHEDVIDEEVRRLVSDLEIRKIVSDTAVLRVVYMQRQRGCKDDTLTGPVDYLKEIGVFLEGERAPTPSGFIQAAKTFYEATPW